MPLIVQMSDVHLGFAYAGLADQQKQRQRQQELWQTFLQALQYCQKIHADLLLIPGDLFDTPNPAPALVQDVQDAFQQVAPLKIMIAAGNHDFAYSGSFWQDAQRPWPENVYLFPDHWASYTFPALKTTVWGASFSAPYAETSLLKAVPAANNDYLQLGVLHGDALTPDHSPYDPLTQAQIASSGLNWLALGHIHKRIEAQAGPTGYGYAGTPEGHGFDEQGAKGVLVLNFTGHTPDVRFQPLAQRRYEESKIDLTGCVSNANAVTTIEAALQERFGADYGRNLYQLQLTGAVPEDALLTTAGIKAGLPVFDLRLRNETHRAVDYQKLAQLDTLAGNFTRRMLDQITASDNNATQAQLRAALAIGVRAFKEDLTNDD